MFDPGEVDQVYQELHRIAAIHVGRSAGSVTLQATQLVHDAWLRLSDRGWPSRTYFLSLASRTMRMLLVDRARARAAQKRPTSRERMELEDSAEIVASLGSVPLEQMIDLDRALDELKALDERKARVVEMRFFGGLQLEEIAEALEVSVSTAKRDWEFSRTWLFARLGRINEEPSKA